MQAPSCCHCAALAFPVAFAVPITITITVPITFTVSISISDAQPDQGPNPDGICSASVPFASPSRQLWGLDASCHDCHGQLHTCGQLRGLNASSPIRGVYQLNPIAQHVLWCSPAPPPSLPSARQATDVRGRLAYMVHACALAVANDPGLLVVVTALTSAWPCRGPCHLLCQQWGPDRLLPGHYKLCAASCVLPLPVAAGLMHDTTTCAQPLGCAALMLLFSGMLR